MADIRARLEQYIVGISQQIEDAKRQLYGLEGGLQLAKQLLADLDADAAEPAPEQNN